MSIPSSGSSTLLSASKTSSRDAIGTRVPRQAVLRELVPRCAGIHERAVLRPDLRIAVERAEPDRDLVTLGPVPAEETGAANRAENLRRRATLGPEDTQQLLALEQSEPLPRNSPLREAEGARVLAAERAVAMVRPAEGQIDLEAHAAAEAASRERQQEPGRRTSSRRSRAKKWKPSTRRTQLQRVHITSECVRALSEKKRNPR